MFRKRLPHVLKHVHMTTFADIFGKNTFACEKLSVFLHRQTTERNNKIHCNIYALDLNDTYYIIGDNLIMTKNTIRVAL